jgi:serine/threonine-protein kinase
MIGTTVGKYRIVGQLGRGATGVVFKAVDETLGREVAIKVLNPDLADADVMRRFQAEATTLARLNHPEIATIYELVRGDRELLMVMELVRGETLEQLSQRLGPIPPERAAYLVDKILSALDHAHRAGIVHRDMKPANVMVTEHGAVKIMDFGIARVRGAEHMTVDGYAIGTPAYMPPEQVLGEQVDGRADVYSVGVIFYRLLTAALPFEADTPIGMLQKQVADDPAPLRRHREHLPEWCDMVVGRALSKAPGDRFQSAKEFRATLARAAGLTTSIEFAKALATPVTESSERLDGPGVFQTVVISRPEVPSTSANASEAATPNGTPRIPHFETMVALAKQFGRTWEVALLASLALFALVAYAALGGTGPAAILADTRPPLTFETKVLLGAGGSQRERDVTVLLADGTITVTADNTPDQPLYTIPFGRLLSVTHSRGRDPMWKSPKGPAAVVRSHGGALGKFGVFVSREWIVLQTDTEPAFVILRVEEGQARPVITALEQRTGRTPEIITGR